MEIPHLKTRRIGTDVSLFTLFRQRGNLVLKATLTFFVLAFLAAFYNHLNDLLRGGLFPYQKWDSKVPGWLNTYWTILTAVDFVSIVLLFYRIKVGLWAYLVVIVSDVFINFSFVIENYGVRSLFNYMQLCQLGFMLFLIVTFLPILKELKRIAPAQREFGRGIL